MNRASAQRHRIYRAVNFAQSCLAQQMSLERMAGAACLSKFHFVKAFQQYCGETPVQFLWRIRLDRAARSLVFNPGNSITDIALDCGFSSSQTFSRAFSRRFGVAPRRLRSDRHFGFSRLPQNLLNESQNSRLSLSRGENLWGADDVRIEDRPKYRIAYVRHIGPYWDADGGISAAYHLLERWGKEKGLWSTAKHFVGICPNNSDITPAAHCIYDAGLIVSDEVCEDDTVSIQSIPAGKFAILQAPTAELQAAWNWLVMTWLPASGRIYALDDCYEMIPIVQDQRDRDYVGTELCMRLGPAG